MNRREVLGLFGAGMLSAGRPGTQASAPEFSALDHIEFYVSSVERSRDFFVRVFGNTLLKGRTNKRYVRLGATYMAFEPPRTSDGEIKVDHVSVAIKGLEMPRLHAFLDQRGVAYQDYPSGRDTAVIDPDGIRLQLSPENGWSLLNPPNFMPEDFVLAEEPVFRPVAMDHVVLSVREPEKSIAFYQKFLGAPQRGNPTWFQVGASRIGLQQASAGQHLGVQYFCLTAAVFSVEVASRRLQQMGATVETADVPGSIRFRDPDGSLLQVSPV